MVTVQRHCSLLHFSAVTFGFVTPLAGSTGPAKGLYPTHFSSEWFQLNLEVLFTSPTGTRMFWPSQFKTPLFLTDILLWWKSPWQPVTQSSQFKVSIAAIGLIMKGGGSWQQWSAININRNNHLKIVTQNKCIKTQLIRKIKPQINS